MFCSHKCISLNFVLMFNSYLLFYNYRSLLVISYFIFGVYFHSFNYCFFLLCIFPIGLHELDLQKVNDSNNGFRALFIFKYTFLLIGTHLWNHSPSFLDSLCKYINMCFYHLTWYILNRFLPFCHVILLVGRRCQEGTLKKL